MIIPSGSATVKCAGLGFTPIISEGSYLDIIAFLLKSSKDSVTLKLKTILFLSTFSVFSNFINSNMISETESNDFEKVLYKY